jgi:hypothetical protein
VAEGAWEIHICAIQQTAVCDGVTMEEIQINISDKTVYSLSRYKTNKMHNLVH